MGRATAIAFILLAASSAHADQVVLHGGSVLEGKAVRRGDQVVIEMADGTVALPSSTVKTIRRGASPIHVYDERRNALADQDVEGRIALADFCLHKGLPGRGQRLLREVLALAPHHAGARERLGYVRTEDGWITRDEYRERQGMVRHEGRWLPADTVAKVERARAETERRRLERQRAESEKEKARLELEAKKVELESERRKLEDEERARNEQPTYTVGWGGWGWGGGGGYWRPDRPSVRPPGCGGSQCGASAGGPARPNYYNWPAHTQFPINGVKNPRRY